MNITETLQNFVKTARIQKEQFHSAGMLEQEMDLELKINDTLIKLNMLGVETPVEDNLINEEE